MKWSWCSFRLILSEKSKTSQLLQRFLHCIGTKCTENKWEVEEEIIERNPPFTPPSKNKICCPSSFFIFLTSAIILSVILHPYSALHFWPFVHILSLQLLFSHSFFFTYCYSLLTFFPLMTLVVIGTVHDHASSMNKHGNAMPSFGIINLQRKINIRGLHDM